MLKYPVDLQYECRGKTVNWFSVDNPHFAKYEADIEYRFNSDGFRMDIEMADVRKHQPLYIGDSTSMGFGINLEDSWAYKHHLKYGGDQFVNLAVASGGIDTTARLLDYWIPVLEPSVIYYLQNAGSRKEFIGPEGIATVVGVWRSVATQKRHGGVFDEETKFLSEVFERYVSSEVSSDDNFNRNMNAIRWVTRFTNTYYCPHSPYNKEYFGGSRDGFHSGPEQHDKLLSWFEENAQVL